MIDFETLSARALNSAKVIHRPSYVGLRLFLESSRRNPSPLLKFLSQRIMSRTSWRYFLFPILKEAGEQKKFSYRDECLVGSPLTIFVEAHILTTMAQAHAFQPSPCVYSYLWPKGKSSGRNFAYFLEGYKRRNKHAASVLRQNSDHIAIISDLRNFYPSVNKASLTKKIVSKAATIKDTPSARALQQFTEGLLNESRNGIPVGPDLSHALGQVFLDSIDQKMQSYYGDRYLRYVDDIIIICPRSESAKAKERLGNAVEQEHLRLHEGKQDEVDALTWLKYDPYAADSGDSFQEFIDDLVLYLIQHPRQEEPLRKVFEAEGFSLPMRRLGGLASSPRFHGYWKFQMIWRRGMRAWLRSLWENPKSLVVRAHAVRESLQRLCTSYAEEGPPDSGMRRRWYVQRRRFVLNRLLYLTQPTEYDSILSYFPEIDEFAESRMVAQALASGDATKILNCPGRVVEAFCQLWSERAGQRPPRISWPESLTWYQIESMAHMALYFRVDPHESLLSRLDERAPGGRILFEIVKGTPRLSSIEKNSYLDEMELLLRGISQESKYHIMTSRFDASETEDSRLELLQLGGAVWSP